MLTCRVKPDYNTCFACMDDQISARTEKDCKDCDLTAGHCEILKLGTGLFGKPYAMVLAGDRIKKVPLNRVCDVKKESERRIKYETYFD